MDSVHGVSHDRREIRRKLAISILFIAALSAAFMMVMPETDAESSGSCGNSLTWTLNDDGLLTVSGTGAMDNWPYWNPSIWWDKSAVTSVVIGEGVTTIGANAFAGCINLNSVDLPNTLVLIDYMAFHDCSLESVVIPDSVKTIGNKAFGRGEGPRTLETVVLGSSLETIDHEAFRNQLSLTSIDLPDGLISIGGYAFDNTRLTSVVIPDSVTSIGYRAFSDNPELTSITLPSGIQALPGGLFAGCTGVTTFVIPSSIKTIGDDAFLGCTSLESVVIPEGVETLGTNAFSTCPNLNSIVLPSTLVSIGKYAFYRCGFESIVIPDSVRSIGDYAFSKYQNETSTLETVVLGSSLETIGLYAFLYQGSLTSIDLPDGLISIGWGAFCQTGLTSVVIPDSVTSISSNAFEGCASLTSATILADVTSIEASTFSNCTSLVSVSLPENLESIGVSAFSRCTSLEEIVLPANITSIGARAFMNCSSLTTMNIPGQVESIGDYAFDQCPSLASMEIPESVTSLGTGAFNSIAFMDGLNELEKIPANIAGHTFLGENSALYLLGDDGVLHKIAVGHSILVDDIRYTMTQVPPDADGAVSVSGYAGDSYNVAIPESITFLDVQFAVVSIDESALASNSIHSVSIPASVSSIGAGAFSGSGLMSIVVDAANSDYISVDGILYDSGRTVLIVCPQNNPVQSLVVPSTVRTIEDKAFYNNKNIVSLEAPSVTSIGVRAFANCSSMASIVLGDVSLGSYAFHMNTALAHAEFGTLASFSSNAFTSVKFYDVDSTRLTANAANLSNHKFADSNGKLIRVLETGDTFVVDGLTYQVSSDTEAFVKGYEGSPTNIAVSDSVSVGTKQFAVDSIGNAAFRGCTTLVSADLSAITSIGNRAFTNCSALESIVVGDAAFNGYAFYGCKALASAEFGNISGVVANDFTGVKLYDIDGTTRLSANASNLGGHVFAGSNGSLIRVAEIGDTIVIAGLSYTIVDSDSVSLTGYVGSPVEIVVHSAVTIGNAEYSVESIGERAFRGCSTLVNADISSVGSIGNRAFTNCSALESIVVGDAIFNRYAFYGCKALAHAEFGNVSGVVANDFTGVKFYDINGTTVLPASSQSLSNRVFTEFDSKLCRVAAIGDEFVYGVFTFRVTSADTLSVIGAENVPSVLEVPAEVSLATTYSVTAIGDATFSGVTNLTRVSVPSSVTSIGTDAFSVTFLDIDGETVLAPTAESLSGSNFVGANGILVREIKVGDTLRQDGLVYTLLSDGNLSLTGHYEDIIYLVVPEKVTVAGTEFPVVSIGSKAFYNYGLLLAIDLGKVQTVEQRSFCYCYGLTSVYFDSVTEIKSYAFYKCTGLRFAYISDSVTTIGASAFSECSNLRMIYISKNLQEIGKNAFYRLYLYDSAGTTRLGYDASLLAGHVFHGTSTTKLVMAS